MRDVVILTEALVAFAAAFVKLSSALRRGASAAGSALLCVSVLCIGISSALWTPLLETLLPPAVAARGRAVAVVVALFCALLAAVHVRHGIACPRSVVGRHVATAAPVVLVLLVLGAWLPVPGPGRLDALDLVAACYVLAAAAELTVLLARGARTATRRSVVQGLWTITAATVAVTVHALCVIGTVLAMWATGTTEPCGRTGVESPPLWLCGMRLGSAVVGPLLIALGLLIPVLSTSCAMLRRGRRDRLLHQRLEPLWATLVAALPGIALSSPVAPCGLGPWNAGARLYRRWVEIRDALLLLHRYRHRDWQCDTPDQEAAAIACALRAHRADLPVEPKLRSCTGPDGRRVDEYLTDVHWLADVADALARHEASRRACTNGTGAPAPLNGAATAPRFAPRSDRAPRRWRPPSGGPPGRVPWRAVRDHGPRGRAAP